MAGVDQILSAIVQQGADELRLGTDQSPVVLAMGATRRFTMSPTSDAVLRQLLGELLSSQRLGELDSQRRCSFEHTVLNVGQFQVTLIARQSGGIDATFLRSGIARSAVAQPTPKHTNDINAPAVTLSQQLNTNSAQASPPSTMGELRCTDALRDIVEQANRLHASDIHLADGQRPYFRVDGRLSMAPNLIEGQVTDYFEISAQVMATTMAGQALEFALGFDRGRRARVSLYRMNAGLASAIRLLPDVAPSLSELNLPMQLDDLAELPHGLVLFCGATGSGKSTTMAALCRHALERRSVQLITLEDPVEFTLKSSPQSLVRQRQIGRDVVDFSAGLRDALRSDPDVIVVGELRDSETIRLALTAAETGHLVLASMHGGSAASCLERVVDAYPAEQRQQIRTQLADALRAVVVQRLVPYLRRAGRVPALEVLRVTHGVANVIREGKTAQIGTMLQGGKRDGMTSLERCLADYVKAGTISPEHAIAAANSVDSLTMYLAK